MGAMSLSSLTAWCFVVSKYSFGVAIAMTVIMGFFFLVNTSIFLFSQGFFTSGLLRDENFKINQALVVIKTFEVKVAAAAPFPVGHSMQGPGQGSEHVHASSVFSSDPFDSPQLAIASAGPAFMRLCVYEGGLFFATSLRLVPSPVVGRAARFLSPVHQMYHTRPGFLFHAHHRRQNHDLVMAH